MPVGRLLQMMGRRWYVVLVGALLTLATAYSTSHQPGVYSAQYNLVLLAPVGQYQPNKITDPPVDLAPLASVLVMDWNRTANSLTTASPETTLFGVGIHRGVQVRLPNQGSQFRPLFTAPYIDVQVADSTPEAVERQASAVQQQLIALLQSRQDEFRVDPRLRVTAIASPSGLNIQYTSGSHARAALATGLVGATLTALAAYAFDRLVGSWRRRRHRARPRLDDDPSELSTNSPTRGGLGLPELTRERR